MSRLEAADQIEGIVGVPRHPELHIGRAVSSEQRVYILHSQRCFDHQSDLRLCPYSLALDAGIEPDWWVEDVPVLLSIHRGLLVGSTTYQPQEDRDA